MAAWVVTVAIPLSICQASRQISFGLAPLVDCITKERGQVIAYGSRGVGVMANQERVRTERQVARPQATGQRNPGRTGEPQVAGVEPELEGGDTPDAVEPTRVLATGIAVWVRPEVMPLVREQAVAVEAVAVTGQTTAR